MKNCLQVFNRDILISLETGYSLRTGIVIDIMDLTFTTPKLIYDEGIIKRFSLLCKFLNQECKNLDFLTDMVNNLDKCSLELVDLYDIYDIVIKNQGLEMIFSQNVTDYIVLKDDNLNDVDAFETLEERILNNCSEFDEIANEIAINNNSIEKIKRKEM